MHAIRTPLAAAAAALALAACGPQPQPEAPAPTPTETPAPSTTTPQRTPRELDPLFAQAAAEFNVPEALLKAISYTQTHWQMVEGSEEFPGMAPAYGLLALRGDALTQAASLSGESVEAVRTDARAHLRAGAALLSAYASELKVDRSDLGAWAPVAARLSGISDSEALSTYIHRGLYATLRQGAVAINEDGSSAATLEPVDVQAQFEAPPVKALAAGPNYAAAVWRPSPNYNARPSGYSPSMIVIHTCEGEYSGCWGWLVNSASQVSAHYVVNESGSEVSQLVREADRAWHVGATYDCSLNGSTSCGLNGVSVNHFAVGIEHGGFASQTSFPAGQIDTSAKLSCDIARDNSIPKDSYHIVAHGRLQPASRTDPGPNWPWSSYISKINSYCGTTSSTLVVDSNNANNDTAKGYIEVSSNWVDGTSSGYYGSGYWYASTQDISDTADFNFYMPAAGTKTIDAWWVAGTNRSAAAPFIIVAGTTTVATVKVSQQINGSQWNTLGTWSFPAGWNKVRLSRWTGEASSVVIADAIRIR
ncbi:N-acetylmuramoyl-L-alanine amidase [Corallococcus sp. H22C18031201]|uniref:golvesin C-terminal-like domain-containing protein n=1 Tax=Citreicoccus inhibens TaxID=2849499 RepID=UPI000E742843|nr:N-acetylmuramoyl-L-alanine amidase [Citreicoccus inhibens]MBU8895725.1 N-acetylmuramoyl-L-alanine amidase [Citreicoccus inhibens]RJS20148.1 N-acetylmuramoyl-L-alanine amidase [Corallococcus sp. H22C18031201]